MKKHLSIITAMLAGVLISAGLTVPAYAATYTASGLSATVGANGSVTATVKVASNPQSTANQYGICVRTASNGNADFAPKSTNVTMTTAGVTYNAPAKTFAPGTYTYFPCLLVGTTWYVPGGTKTFTVPQPRTTPSGVSMPTGNSGRPGFTYSYGQDFTNDAALGSFDTVYGQNWNGYVCDRCDSSKNIGSRTNPGSYVPDLSLSVSSGVLKIRQFYDSASNRYIGSAPFPQPPAGVNGGSQEYTGMRTSVRFKSTGSGTGHKVAWLFWPASYDWSQGEIDFPEASLDDNIGGFSHPSPCYTNVNAPVSGQVYCGNNMLSASSTTKFSNTGWHTAVTEWEPRTATSPGRAEFFLDGVSLGSTTTRVPADPMHWTIQSETHISGTNPPTTTDYTTEIDWLTVEAYTG